MPGHWMSRRYRDMLSDLKLYLSPRNSLLSEISSFYRMSRDKPAMDLVENIPLFLGYACRTHLASWAKKMCSRVFYPLPEEDGITVKDLTLDSLEKLPIHHSMVHMDGTGPLSLKGFRFSDYVGSIRGKVGFHSGFLERDYRLFWTASMVHKVVPYKEQKKWEFVRDVLVGFHQEPEPFQPDSCRDFGITIPYGRDLLEIYGHCNPGIRPLVGRVLGALTDHVMEALEEQDMVDELFERYMEKSSFKIDLGITPGLDDESEIIDSIERDGVVHERFLYKGEGGEHFLKILESENYRTSSKEERLLEEYGSDILSGFPGPVTLVDLGCGDGSKARVLLDMAPEESGYFPVDISLKMLYRAFNRTSEGREFRGALTSFENMGRIPGVEGSKLYMLLGNTCSNYSEEGQAGLLSGIAGNMDPWDRLLVGIEHPANIEFSARQYRDNPSRDLAFNPLKRVGLKQEDFAYSVDTNMERNWVELSFTPRTRILAEYKGRQFGIPEGKRVVMIISRRSDPAGFASSLEGTGLEIENVYSGGDYSLVLSGIKEGSLSGAPCRSARSHIPSPCQKIPS